MLHARTIQPLRAVSHALAFLTVLAIASAGWGKIVYVNRDGGGMVHDGASWATACLTVQAGISAATANDEVWVAKGIYYETVSFPQASVAVYGGFTGIETTQNQRDWKANPTVLDGNSTSGAVVESFLPGALLDGFTVRNGQTAVAMYNTATIANCTLNGQAYGAYLSNYPATVTNCLIVNNDVGVYATGGSATITHCNIIGNGTYGLDLDHGTGIVANSAVGGNGKGIYLNGGSASITACTITQNLTEGLNLLGAATVRDSAICGNGTRGLYVDGGNTATIINCTIAANTSIGVCIVRGSAPTINSIIAYNGTGFFRFDPSGYEELSHNDVYGNSAGNYVTVPDPANANGNISADPSFADRFASDFRLLQGSPCIDTADDMAVLSGDKDLDGLPRITGAHVDMGAYESGPAPFVTADLVKSLRIAAGLEAAPTDISRWNVETAFAGIDLLDAIRLARKVGGLEPNP